MLGMEILVRYYYEVFRAFDVAPQEIDIMSCSFPFSWLEWIVLQVTETVKIVFGRFP